MQSVGEVMAIGRTFPESFQKAIRGLEQGRYGLNADPAERGFVGMSDAELMVRIAAPTPDRPFQIEALLRRGVTLTQICEVTKIDPWFIDQLVAIVNARHFLDEISQLDSPLVALTPPIWRRLKRLGFSDAQFGYLFSIPESAVRSARIDAGVIATFKTVDTCAAEFGAETPYYYSTYEDEDEVKPGGRPRAIILGSGPNRIGQGIEFDYCCVHASMALREAGYETVMINCNPETVSTDYDTSDRLYFEPITEEDVLAVIDAERRAGGEIKGVIVGLGGQTPLKLSGKLAPELILGTSAASIDLAEDRERWNQLCGELEIPQPAGATATNLVDALKIIATIGYPALVRPSYVLGGRAMEIVYDDEGLAHAMATIAGFTSTESGQPTVAGTLGREGGLSAERPVLIDHFLEDAVEVDVDAVRDHTGELLIGGVLEHVEEAGVHSGDSACVIPPPTLSEQTIATIIAYTNKIAAALEVCGPINVQYAVQLGQVYVIEANPRASRTVPFVAKATGVPLAKIAARVMAGSSLGDLRTEGMLVKVGTPTHVSVKEAVLPFDRFPEVDALLGPEMRSTGEVMGVASTYGLAFAKSQIAAGNPLPRSGSVFLSLADRDKASGFIAAQAFADLGFNIAATTGTAAYLEAKGVTVTTLVSKLSEGDERDGTNFTGSQDDHPDWIDGISLIASGSVTLVVNTPRGRGPRADGAYLRRAAALHNVPVVTTVAAARAAAQGIRDWRALGLDVTSIQEHHAAMR
jgi:carbamoyl-phosphate synthase large subunit